MLLIVLHETRRDRRVNSWLTVITIIVQWRETVSRRFEATSLEQIVVWPAT